MPLFIDELMNRAGESKGPTPLVLTMIGAALLAFAFSRFLEIYLEKWLLIEWANRLRRSWYGKALIGTGDADSFGLSRLMTKITYHFGLLQMGLKNAFFCIPKLVVGPIALIVAAFFISWPLLVFVCGSILTGLFLIWIGNYLAKNYVSQDQTLYSRMLLEIQSTVGNRLTHRQQGNIAELVESFDELVQLDSHFRLRRELWVRFSPQVVFLILSLIAIAIISLESNGLQFSSLF